MAPGLVQDIAFFGGFDIYRKKDRAAAGSADAKITPPLFDVIYDLRGNSDPGNTGRIQRLTGHYAGYIVERW